MLEQDNDRERISNKDTVFIFSKNFRLFPLCLTFVWNVLFIVELMLVWEDLFKRGFPALEVFEMIFLDILID